MSRRTPCGARACSDGLHAILELHFAQEDEGYLSLVDDPDDRLG